MRFPLLAPALVLFLIATPPGAASCWTTASPEIATCNLGGTGAGTGSNCHYVDVDLPGDTRAIFDVYVYRESNGIPGLQRGDAGINNTCGGVISSDTMVI